MDSLSGKVLITGGAGFLGRAIMKTALDLNWDCEFVVYSRDEQKQDAVRRRGFNARTVLGDIRDTERLTLAMTGVDYVIHAGALKYIPEAEFNASECHSVNVGGSISVIRAARAAEVPIVLAISTDKAVMPLNVYGATKMLMERLFVEADLEGQRRNSEWPNGPRFGVIRYGNVVGSTGSIVPLWQHQAKTNGKITITDPDMTRFWMSARDAVNLVMRGIDSLENGHHKPGEIVVQRAPAMLIGALFEALNLGVPAITVGRRPGEKLDETLLSEYEAAKATYNGGSYVHFTPLGETSELMFPAIAYESSTPNHWMTDLELMEAVDQASSI